MRRECHLIVNCLSSVCHALLCPARATRAWAHNTIVIPSNARDLGVRLRHWGSLAALMMQATTEWLRTLRRSQEFRARTSAVTSLWVGLACMNCCT